MTGQSSRIPSMIASGLGGSRASGAFATQVGYPCGRSVVAMETVTAGQDQRTYLVLRRMSFVALLVGVAVIGVRIGVHQSDRDTGPSVVLAPLLCSLSAALWCYCDGRVRGKPALRVNLEGVIWALAFGFPAYCVWSRGARGVLLLLGVIAAASAALVLGLLFGFAGAVLFGVPAQ